MAVKEHTDYIINELLAGLQEAVKLENRYSECGSTTLFHDIRNDCTEACNKQDTTFKLSCRTENKVKSLHKQVIENNEKDCTGFAAKAICQHVWTEFYINKFRPIMINIKTFFLLICSGDESKRAQYYKDVYSWLKHAGDKIFEESTGEWASVMQEGVEHVFANYMAGFESELDWEQEVKEYRDLTCVTQKYIYGLWKVLRVMAEVDGCDFVGA